MNSYYSFFGGLELPYDLWSLMNYCSYSWPVPRKSNQRKIRKLRRRTRP